VPAAPGPCDPAETNLYRWSGGALTLVNVLDVRQGDGTYATSLAPSLLLEALSFIVDFHRDDTVLEFFEVRRILEPAATGLAAVRMSPEEKAELGKILDAVTVESPVDDFVATDLEFHKKIAVGSGNSVLASLVDNMSLPTARARIWRGMTEPGALERTLAEHRAILEALASHEPEVARSRPPRICSRVDLPCPVGPWMAIHSPSAISRSTPCSAWTVWRPFG